MSLKNPYPKMWDANTTQWHWDYDQEEIVQVVQVLLVNGIHDKYVLQQPNTKNLCPFPREPKGRLPTFVDVMNNKLVGLYQ